MEIIDSIKDKANILATDTPIEMTVYKVYIIIILRFFFLFVIVFVFGFF